MKIEKLRYVDGKIRGYKLGNLYLLKNYNWDNSYYWYISTKDYYSLTGTEFAELYNEKKVELVDSYKEGKEILEKRS